ncbi:hypothetical protein CLOBOL_03992 [Enterocloster bolteae ATCC BAA-613]|uniref:Uncharacterized protein n=1 Tax=Enterocloster bolteae (strain ATCC BAA-613 / DSM 15670 / CCUG 46953 / JCM 12243 / WAL 16351) TaxID=411902 RepID=A8RUE5_ENTBW|nr:hypothetical protein CLOBOL_03992 [Enterocloster bolteae ATCC BAA-613]
MKQNISRKKTLSLSYRQAVSFFCAIFSLVSACQSLPQKTRQ